MNNSANTALEELAREAPKALGGTVERTELSFGELTLHTKRQSIPELLSLLKASTIWNFSSFIDLCAVDWVGRNPRFDVVYHLLSPGQNLRVRIIAGVDELESVPSIVSIYPGAIWFEREAYDLYGLKFSGHPDLRRLLTDYGFEGHPLRKDFPLSGHWEVRYDAAEGKLRHEAVALEQGYRDFDFLSPWEGPARHDLPENPNDESGTP